MPFSVSGAPHIWKRPPQHVHRGFIIRFTGEIFASYEGYMQRIEMYQRRQWVCSRTMKGPLTFEEALFSEERSLLGLTSKPIEQQTSRNGMSMRPRDALTHSQFSNLLKFCHTRKTSDSNSQASLVLDFQKHLTQSQKTSAAEQEGGAQPLPSNQEEAAPVAKSAESLDAPSAHTSEDVPDLENSPKPDPPTDVDVAAVKRCLEAYVRRDSQLEMWTVDDPRLVAEFALTVLFSDEVLDVNEDRGDSAKGTKRSADVSRSSLTESSDSNQPPHKRARQFPVPDEEVEDILRTRAPGKKPSSGELRNPWGPLPLPSSQSVGASDFASHFAPLKVRAQDMQKDSGKLVNEVDSVDWWEREHALRSDVLMVYAFLHRFSSPPARLLPLSEFPLADFELALAYTKGDTPSIVVESCLALLELIDPKLIKGAVAVATVDDPVNPGTDGSGLSSSGLAMGDFLLPARQTRSGGSSYASAVNQRHLDRQRVLSNWESTLKKYLLEKWGAHQARYRKKIRRNRERQRRAELQAEQRRISLEKARAVEIARRQKAFQENWDSDQSETESSSHDLSLESEEEDSLSSSGNGDEQDDRVEDVAEGNESKNPLTNGGNRKQDSSDSSPDVSDDSDAEENSEEELMDAQGLPRVLRADVLTRFQQSSFRSLPLSHKVWIFTQLVSDAIDTKKFRKHIDDSTERQAEIMRAHREKLHEQKSSSAPQQEGAEQREILALEARLEKTDVRLQPLGYDRWFQRYWSFPGSRDRVWVELPPRTDNEDALRMRLGSFAYLNPTTVAKVSSNVVNPLPSLPDLRSPTFVDDGRRTLAQDAVLQRRFVQSGTSASLSKHMKHVHMYGGASAWGFYDQAHEVDGLVSEFDPRGERELELLEDFTGHGSSWERKSEPKGRHARMRADMEKREEARTASLANDDARRSRRIQSSSTGPSFLSWYNSLYI